MKWKNNSLQFGLASQVQFGLVKRKTENCNSNWPHLCIKNLVWFGLVRKSNDHVWFWFGLTCIKREEGGDKREKKEREGMTQKRKKGNKKKQQIWFGLISPGQKFEKVENEEN